MVDETALAAICDRCLLQTLRYAGRVGFTHSDFATRVPAYRQLPNELRFRVLVMLAKRRDVSSIIGPLGAWHFYARSLAPPGALNLAKRTAGEALARAVKT